jgi:hypothetical protein
MSLSCQPRVSLSTGMQARRKQAVICLLLEGNWLPITNVLVNQVGKYRYQLYSPHENTSIHLVIDILLVSRTKVISVHSPVWIENTTDLTLEACLHVPTSLLALMPDDDDEVGARGTAGDHGGGGTGGTSASTGSPVSRVGSGEGRGGGGSKGLQGARSRGRSTSDLQAHAMPSIDEAARGAQRSAGGVGGIGGERSVAGGGDRVLQPLRPGSGRYLPLAAMLDGVLTLTPQGAQSRFADRRVTGLVRTSLLACHLCTNAAAPGSGIVRQVFQSPRSAKPIDAVCNSIAALGATAAMCVGHEQSERDVLRISDDLSALAAQQGYLHAQSSPCVAALGERASAPGALPALAAEPHTTTNCFLQVTFLPTAICKACQPFSRAARWTCFGEGAGMCRGALATCITCVPVVACLTPWAASRLQCLSKRGPSRNCTQPHAGFDAVQTALGPVDALANAADLRHALLAHLGARLCLRLHQAHCLGHELPALLHLPHRPRGVARGHERLRLWLRLAHLPLPRLAPPQR